MLKAILSSIGVLFVVTLLISGCSKPEEKTVEAPPETKQTMEQPAPAVQEQAAEMKEETGEQAEPTGEVAQEQAEPTGEAAEEKAPAVPDEAKSEAMEIDTSVDVTLEQFKADIKGGDEFLQSAKGVLVFPKVIKAGFIVGGSYGEGALRIGGKTVDYYNTVAASFGFLAGAQSVRVIIVFMQDDALKKFRESKGWEAGVDGSVTLVNVGAAGTIDTTTIKDPIVGFVFGNKGLMADLSLAGSKYTKIVR
jgi:lipid-binding SYLF domain-containing protein